MNTGEEARDANPTNWQTECTPSARRSHPIAVRKRNELGWFGELWI